jgi:glycerol-3-phosphate acyltransferase PlsX
LSTHDTHIVIAVDAMGGDHAPAAVVEGALDAIDLTGGRFTSLLVGDSARIESELRRFTARTAAARAAGALQVHHASEVIEMHDHPNAALRTKKDSSIAVGLELHRAGTAAAFVSAGNTGAVLSASTLTLGRIPGVARPTIGAMIPTAGDPCLLVDAGTNVDCPPRHLFEFGVMGSAYIGAMRGKDRPSIGLLSIGEEETKGNVASLGAFALLKASGLNFLGNIEGRDLLAGKVDVAVCDGFVGNILLKFGESVPGFFKARFSRFARAGFMNSMVALIARNGLRSVMRELDYQEHGGVPLLGINGVSIIGHGRSTPKAIMNMILRAEEMVQAGVNRRIRETLQASKHGDE